MEVQKILESKETLIKFLKEKGLEEEKDYFDDEYKEGIYFKIDKRKLLVVYEIVDEEKLKEVKDHFLIDRGLSYCVIIYNHKIIFFRSFGETKHFIYSERTKNNRSKIDKLENISVSIDSLFQSKDISAQFYEAFKQKRNLLVQHIKNNIEPIEKYLIAQKIFDRFFFIYFLCHKGIIKFEDGGKISGENLFSRILLKKGNFLENLKKLFHLFNSVEKNILEIEEYKIVIPYLNGGLFRPDVLEQDLDISLTNKQWEEIFEFLNSYHWIIEDVKATEEHEERILTPEILGHVYERSVVEWEQKGFEKEAEESVKKISERKKKGVYYTPESITDYISKNTIIPFLLDKLGNKYSSFGELMESKNKKDMKNALKILDEIKVLDPACGSGAFLIKASEVIFGLKRRLYYGLGEKKNFYDMKLNIITENIYGVDILQGAIEIAKLRLWLWLISDFEESKNEIKALPNIEYNLKVGNSLIGWLDENLKQMPINTPLTEKVDGIFTGLIAFSENGDAEDLKKAREMLKGYKLDDYIEAYYILYKIYRRTHGLKAENLRSILKTIRESIYSAVTPAFLDYVTHKIKPKFDSKNPPITKEEFDKLQVFHWRIDFGHIIKQGGFDVVIGNPPYISFGLRDVGKLPNYMKKFYNSLYSNSAEYKINIYPIFMQRGIDLTKESGRHGFIVPDSFLLGRYFSKIRKYILENCRIKKILFLPYVVFPGATIGVSIIYIFEKNIHNKDNKLKAILAYDNSQIKNDGIKSYSYSQSYFLKTDYNFDKKIMDLIEKIEKNSKRLEDFMTGRTGVRSLIGQKNIISKEKKGSTWQKGIVSSSQVTKYHVQYLGDYINIEPKLLNKGGWDYDVIHNPKLFVRQTGDSLTAAVDFNGYYHLNNVHSFALDNDRLDLLYLLALFNSKLLDKYYKFISLEEGRTMAQTDIETLEKLPIKDIPKFQQKPFIDLVNQILSITKSKDYLQNKQKQAKVKKIQDKIDKLVYRLYGLDEEEIKIVEEAI